MLFKLDRDGRGDEIQLRHLGANSASGGGGGGGDGGGGGGGGAPLSFLNWTDDMFLDMCLLLWLRPKLLDRYFPRG